ncbi:heat shock protein homolog Sse1p [Trichomonascus vanleenenianus]|uniref:heat shock protein homolog Sse1p n=1 Tax=Trichomonascus vanleenenianus TaxID=2268995 RepID=UPI003EC981D0
MSVPTGIDFGNYSTVIGVARNRGIDVVVNEVSNRSTPSLVGFGMKSRFLGEQAKSNEISNLKNTVGSLKRILGRTSNDPNVAVEQQYNNAKFVDIDGQCGAEVRFKGEVARFTSTQLAAMYFDKLKQTTEQDCKGAKVSDVVIAVPVWYSEVQRRACADAAVIAGVNPVRVVNDVTAAAVSYGVFKNAELPEDDVRKVAIVDVGNSSFTVTIAQFKKGELKVLGTAYDKDFGGRVLDMAIVKHFAEEFKDKYKIDITSNPKAFSRVLTQAEKLKKVLSANSVSQFSVESVMNDIDVSSSMKRETLESFIAPHLERMSQPVERALKAAGLSAADLDFVEVIGGTSRVPAVKEKLQEIFGKPLSFTLNADEAVARGAAFICAIHSPTVRVRPFKFEDLNQFSVTYSWTPVADEDVSELEVFPAGGSFPNTKVITLFRSEDFDLEARYTHPEQLEEGQDAWVGKWSIKGVKPSESGEPVAVKCKLRQDPSGFYTIESAYTAEEVEVEEPVEGETKEGEEPKTKKVKKWVRKDTLSIVHSGNFLTEQQVNNFLEIEAQLTEDDKLVADTEDRKNALEEYIYEIRGKIEEELKDFASDEEKQKIQDLAMAAEEWLYSEEGEDASKGQYVAKYEELASIGNLVKGRYLSKLEEERQAKRAAFEAEQQRKMAEKIAAERAAKEAAEKEKQEGLIKDEEGDTQIPDAQ